MAARTGGVAARGVAARANGALRGSEGCIRGWKAEPREDMRDGDAQGLLSLILHFTMCSMESPAAWLMEQVGHVEVADAAAAATTLSALQCSRCKWTSF